MEARAQAALGHAALRTFGDGSSSTGHRLRTFGDGSYARVLIGSTGHRPRSAPQPQAPQRYHRPETSRRHRPWPQAPQRCHRPQAPRLHRLHGPRASQHSPPATGPSALSSAVNSSCKDLAWKASCPSGVTGRGKKNLGKKKAAPDDDRRRRVVFGNVAFDIIQV